MSITSLPLFGVRSCPFATVTVTLRLGKALQIKRYCHQVHQPATVRHPQLPSAIIAAALRLGDLF